MRLRPPLVAIGTLTAAGLALLAWDLDHAALGAGPGTGARATRVAASPQFGDGIFVNPWPFAMATGDSMATVLREYAFGDAPRTPIDPLPVETPDLAAPPADGLRVTWLGHSTLLVELDGRRVLTDPHFTERASPFRHLGPRRFHPPPLSVAALPPLDAVLLSHDHYDHLDRGTVAQLAERVPEWHVPLGVGAHLEAWGIPPERVVEHDWWEGATLAGDVPLTLTATPSQHFSGRGLGDRFRTLWSSWVIATPAHRVYFSGDTGYHPAFGEIARRLGPFDLAALEAGAWNAAWADVHLGPQGFLNAAVDLGKPTVMPIHWATFDLATHGWKWPAEEIARKAGGMGVTVTTPRLGGAFAPSGTVGRPTEAWWASLR